MGSSGDVPMNGFDVTHDPLERIDGMNRLVDERAATVERPGTAPAPIGIVVVLSAVPMYRRIAQDETPEIASLDGTVNLVDVL